MIKLLRTAAFMLCTAVAAPVMAQDYDKVLEASRAGDCKTALQEWRPLAEQGNAAAQFNLGQMYFEGEGVPQDDDEALKWYRLAAEQGIAAAQSNLAGCSATAMASHRTTQRPTCGTILAPQTGMKMVPKVATS